MNQKKIIIKRMNNSNDLYPPPNKYPPPTPDISIPPLILFSFAILKYVLSSLFV